MEIVDLTEAHYRTFFCCLEDWSEDMKDAGVHKELWFQKMKDQGLRVKLAVVDGKACGMIQYTPAEYSATEGEGYYFIHCIWVHGHKQGIGNFHKRGIGKALLQAAEEDIRARDQAGVAAWGISLPFWMKASWFRKQGYRKVDKNGMAVLMWKPFREGAEPPRWIKEKKRPAREAGVVTVTSFLNGWCPAQNIIHERARRAAQEFGDVVRFKEVDTFDRCTLCEWGIADAVYIDDKRLGWGPPPSYEKIKNKIAKRVKKAKK